MIVKLRLDDCGIDPRQFVGAWNEHSDSSPNRASVASDNTTGGPAAGAKCAVAGEIVISVATGIAASVIYDLIKATIRRIRPDLESTHIQVAPSSGNQGEARADTVARVKLIG